MRSIILRSVNDLLGAARASDRLSSNMKALYGNVCERTVAIPADKQAYFKRLSSQVDNMLHAMERGEKVDRRLYYKLEGELEKFLDDMEHAAIEREEDEDTGEDLEPDYENSISLEDDLANIYATWKFGYQHWESEDEVAETIWDAIDNDWFNQEPRDMPRPIRSKHSTAQLIDLAQDAWLARQKRLRPKPRYTRG